MHPVVADLTAEHLRALDEGLPGVCLGLYLTGSVAAGDFHPHTSDVDAVVVLAEQPSDPLPLKAIHDRIAGPPAYDVVYLTAADLAGDPGEVRIAPGTLDGRWHDGPVRAHVSPLTWTEMARYAVPVRECPGLVVDDDHDRLVAFARRTLEDYWAPLADRVEETPPEDLAVPGAVRDAAVWTVLGVARLHLVLTSGHVASKTAAGQYALQQFPDWADLVTRCLAWRGGHDVAFDPGDAPSVVAMARAVIESARVLPDPAPAAELLAGAGAPAP